MDIKVKNIIQKNIEAFLGSINDAVHKARNNSFDILNLEYEVFERNQERSIKKYSKIINFINYELRRYLIIYLLDGLLSYHNVFHSTSFPQNTENYMTADFDKVHEYVFLVDKDLYRFSHLEPSEKQFLLDKYKIENIYELNFKKQKLYKDEVYIKDFFYKYFHTSNLYEYYINEVSKALKKAEEIAGLSTIQNLTPKNLNIFKIDLVKKILNHDYKNNFELSNDDYGLINKQFFENRMFELLVGDNDIAKCFITSEFLYSIIGKENNFDYSSIVFGYFKAFEILVNTIFEDCKSDKGYPYYAEYDEKKKNSIVFESPYDEGKKIAIIYKKENEDVRLFHKISSFLYNDLFWKLSKEGRLYINNILNMYRSKCRNGYVHLDNIYCREKVEEIRNWTWICLYYLLGAINHPSILTNASAHFDYKYALLYKRIMDIPWAQRKFIIEIDGAETKLILDYYNTKEHIEYDENGEITNSLVFFVVNNFNSNPNDKPEEERNVLTKHIIDKSNVPEKIYWQQSKGDVVELSYSTILSND